VLQAEGFIRGYAEVEFKGGQKELEIELKYHDGHPVIRELKRVSTPGRRVYAGAKELRPGLRTKTGLMLGLGEEPDEVRTVLRDLRAVACDVLTLGQYLQPSTHELPVARYVPPEEFDALGEEARAMGFAYVESGPLVRSSYHAWRHTGAAEG